MSKLDSIKKWCEEHKVLVLAVAFILVAVLAYSCGNEDAVEQGYENTVNDTQVEQKTEEKEEPEQTEDEDVDTYVNDNPNPNTNDVEGAYDLMKPYVDEHFAGMNYAFEIKEGNLFLRCDIPTSELYATDMTTWNSLVETAEECSVQWKATLDSYGYTNIHFSIMVGDFSADSYYLLVTDGHVLYDAPNGVNYNN